MEVFSLCLKCFIVQQCLLNAVIKYYGKDLYDTSYPGQLLIVVLHPSFHLQLFTANLSPWLNFALITKYIMKNTIQNLLSRVGLKLIRYPESDLKRRMQLFRTFGINKIIDVGANAGQYALTMRKLGYSGPIISFEPLRDAFSLLQKASAGDENWQIHNIALGEEDRKAEINVADNSYSSSLLDIMPAHVHAAPQSRYVSKQEVTIRKLDSIFADFYHKQDRILLKIDTQGFEKNVIDGAEQSLSKITGIQVEMSLQELYSREMLFSEMIHYLGERGFDLYSLENGFSDPESGRLLQVDGIFFKKS